MAPVSTPPAPGSMTVPPLFGWETILTGLLLLIAVAVVALVVVAARAGASGRSEWQAALDARSRRWDAAPEPGTDGPGRTAS
ncbi:hypothetical protein [Geodermatophilus sp. URMC 64]